MNILILYKDNENKNIIKDSNNNNLYFFKQKEYSYKKIKNLKNEKDIQIILYIGKNNFLLNIYSSFLNIPVVYTENSKNTEDIEVLLQNKLAYKDRKDLPVLMYHRVIDDKSEIGFYDTYVTKENFEMQMKYLSENSYTSVTFKDIQNGEYKRRFDKDKKYVIITFDDGYKDNLKNALPILKKYNMKMVLFLITSETYNKWDTDVENREKEKKFNLMTKEEVKELIASDLVEIGGHTTKHLDMPNVDLKTIEEDLNISNKIIEEITGYKPISFAYPWGRSTKESRDVVKKVGYKFAVSTEDGPACFSDDLFEIVRVGIYSDDDIEKFKLRISGKYPFIREKRKEMKAFRNKIRKFFGIKTKQ